METYTSLADAKKAASSKSVKVGKGNFTQLKFKTKTGKAGTYKRGHNSQ